MSINQPAYMPWLGYFHRLAISDLHIVLDDVQIDFRTKTQFTNRNRLRTPQGWCWITVPLKTKGMFDQRQINRLEIVDDGRWQKKHFRTLQQNYAKAPAFAAHQPFLDGVFSSDWRVLADLLRETTEYLQGALGITTPKVFSSDLGIAASKTDLLVELCRQVEATTYVSGPFGRDYLDRTVFDAAGIDVVFQEYEHPVYPQAHPGFEPYMSALDLLLNCGDESREILMRDQRAVA